MTTDLTQNETTTPQLLSPWQRHICSLPGGASHYCSWCILRLEGPVDRPTLREALAKCIARHAVLRTVFSMPGGEPLAHVITEQPFVRWIAGNPSSIPETVALLESNPFDLEHGPLVHAVLASGVSGDELGLAASALCADVTTLRLIVQETLRVYAGEPEVPAAITFREIANWQARLLESPSTNEGVDYWPRQNFSAGVPHVFAFPPPTGDNPAIFSSQTYRLSSAVSNTADRFCVAERVLLLACWQALLKRLSPHSELVVGVRTDLRSSTELEGALGPLSHYLPCKAPAEMETYFSVFLEEIQQRLEEATAYQHYFNPSVHGANPFVLPICFTFTDSTWSIKAGALTVTPLESSTVDADFELELRVVQTREGFFSTCYGSRSVIESDGERLAQEFQKIVSSVVDRSDTTLDQLDCVGEVERARLIDAFNPAPSHFRPARLDELISAQAVRNPESPAVICADQQMTFAELEQEANRLAFVLAAQGVRPERRVGLLLRRSPRMVVAVLAVLKSGGAFVPLDSTTTSARLTTVAADAELHLILTELSLRDRLHLSPEQMPADRIVCLDVEDEFTAPLHRVKELPQALTDNLAYVLFTSGSTGVPKGVMVSHAALTNYVLWASRTYRADFGVGTPVHSSLSFDLTITSLCCPLVSGRAIVLMPEENTMEALAQSLQSGTAFSLVKITPSHLIVLSEYIDPSRPLGPIGFFVIGGENLSGPALQFWRSHLRGTHFINEYGPSETVVGCCVYKVSPDDMLEGPVPIGSPIDNTRLFVVDSQLNLVPTRAPGELCVAGAGVARGYLGDPVLTAEKFVPDPFGGVPGARLYRTGDLVRRQPSGILEFLGRLDGQVKIRGFRVELGEVEAILSQHPAVQAVCVATAERTPGQKQLTAYVKVRSGFKSSPSDLRRWTSERLPEYMVPASFVALDELPLTTNGKIDLAKLEATSAWVNSARQVAPPTTETERLLAKIWCELLSVEQVGIHDNFFELGGDSITSIQVVSRANQLGLRITARNIFECQNIAELAAIADSNSSPATPSRPVAARAPLAPLQHWFYETARPDPRAWTQSLVLEISSTYDAPKVEAAIRAAASRHDVFRIGFFQTPSGPEQRIVADQPQILFEARDLPKSNQQSVADASTDSAINLRAQFDLAKGLLAGCVLLTKASDPVHHLVIVIHHLIVDGVSWRILLQDFEALLTAPDSVTQAPAASWLACAQRLNECACSPELNAQLEYWVAEARSNVLPLKSSSNGDRGKYLPGHASAGVISTALLDETARKVGATPQELLLTALLNVFSAKYGTEQLLVDLEAHGRTEILADIPGTPAVGPFTAVFPVLLSCSAVECSSAVPVIQLANVPDDGVGYGLLRYCAPTRAPALALRSMPSAEVLFNYLGSFDNVTGRERSPIMGVHVLRIPDEDFASHRFAISAQSVGGHVQVHWSCRDAEEQALSAKAFLDAYRQELNALCSSTAAPAGSVPESAHGLSPLQSGMLFRSLSDPASGEYFEQATCLLGNIENVDLLLKAWQIVVRRHEAFRSAFVVNERGAFEQGVYKTVDLPILQEDWRDVPPAERKARLDDFLARDRAVGFQVERPPLFRLALFRMGADEYQFTLSFHHAILDGWSLHLVLGEVVAVYGGLNRGRAPSLPPVTRFADYIQWLNGQDLTNAAEFWRRTLRHYRTPVRISSEAAERATVKASERGSVCDRDETAVLPASTTAALSAVAQKNRVTLATLVQGAWALVLSTHTGEKDVVFGFVTSGRSAPIQGVETIVGMMMNTVPVRALVRGEVEVAEWLRELQSAWAETVVYEHTPNPTIRAASELDGAEPLFETALVYENYPTQVSAAIGDSGLTISRLTLKESTGLPLTVVVRPAESLSVCFTFDNARIEQSIVRRMLSQFVRMLEAIAANPHTRIAELPLADKDALARIASQWGPAHVQSHAPRCLHEWFAEQAAKTPRSIAVSYEDETCTYEELNRRANAIAARLQGYGVGPNVPVVLIFEPSVTMICAIVGVLKAGGFYVPVDSRQPRTRTAQILNEVSPPVVLAESHLAPIAPPEFDVLITDDVEFWEDAAPSSRVSEPQDLAYMIYTSGSTGKPKGVQITHTAASILFLTNQTLFEFKPTDVWTMFHSYTFDFAVWEMWGALLFGGKLILVPGWMTRSPEDFYSLLDDQGVTVLNQTPSALRMLIGVSPDGLAPRSVRLIISGGEALDFKILAPWLENSQARCRITNMYGITETTVHVTHRDVTAADLASSVRGFIGDALPSLRIYILGREMVPAPVGVPGEIYVGGDQLARGYWSRPDLTAERFVPDPFSLVPGQRLYRSGDLARWHENGELEYVGRADRQVKVRGFRIELGEIEVALRRCHNVRDAVVVQRSDNDSSRLVAYVVMQEDFGTEELRRQMLDLMPEYMIPASFIRLAALPLTPNGKVDRQALPADDEPGAQEVSSYVAPRTPSEAVLACIWQEALGVARVGIHDNFFALGGDSIIGLQIAARARQEGIPITPVALFRWPTVAGLVAEGIQSEKEQAPSDGSEKPLTPIQLWFFEQNINNPHFWNQAVLLVAKPSLEFARLAAAVQTLLDRHDALRGRFAHDSGQWRRHTVSAEARALTEVDLADVPPQLRRNLIACCAAQANAALHVTAGPLHRWVLFTQEAHSESLLLIAIHHLVVDTVSWRILVQDLESVYDQLASGEAVQLPHHSNSYDEWARALVNYARDVHTTAEGRYWLEGPLISDPEPVPPVPLDFSDLPNTEESRRVETYRFEPEQTAALLAAVSASEVSVEEALLAALAAAWHKWARQSTVFIDLEHHGREDVLPGIDVSRTVGWFTALAPVLLPTNTSPSMRALLADIHRQLQAIPDRGIGYGILRYLSLDPHVRSLLHPSSQGTGRRIKPEIAFNYLGHLDRRGHASRFNLVEDVEFPVRDPLTLRSHVLEFNASILQGSLNIGWFYSEHRHRLASIRTLLAFFNAALQELITNCGASRTAVSVATSGSVR